ncbi:helicase HerA domain-containing protein [Tautonia rosea]|uniref:helicase HerA domain-containing protein n=1 Tax=Tautonia rosea TaxID=2728037 RepID=UPI0014745F1A|nr:DUF87 domain-containing protein [Tautonia rosea]
MTTPATATAESPLQQKKRDVLRQVDFDWAMHLSSIWRDSESDVPGLHENLRREFTAKIDAIAHSKLSHSPLGWVITGSAGTGKTHLLGSFRRKAAHRRAGFVLVDMTDVRDFWETVLQGYVLSLQVPYEDETFQHQCLLRNLISRLGPDKPVSEVLKLMADRPSANLKNDIQKILTVLHKVYPQEILKYQNTIRALACLNSTDFHIVNLGMTWLQSQPLDPEERTPLGYTTDREEPKKIVEAISWIMSLCGPTVLAFDQLDPIVTELAYRERSDESPEGFNKARAIISHIGSGLGAIRDTTRRTLAIVSCIEATWKHLEQTVLLSAIDRFEPPRRLDVAPSAAINEAIVRSRLSLAFQTVGYTPSPGDSWPFHPKAFASVGASTPREVLQKCEQCRIALLHSESLAEITDLGQWSNSVEPPDDLKQIDDHFAQACSTINLRSLTDDESLAPLFQTALQCLLWEREPGWPPEVDTIIDTDFAGGKTTKPLHARLRLIFQNENGREEHFCMRVIQHERAIAYQSRLQLAMTQSGIDRDLPFRHLRIIRTHPFPGGEKTTKLTESFETTGGKFLKPTENDLRTLAALHQLKRKGVEHFRPWLQSRKPLSSLDLIKKLVPSPLLLGIPVSKESSPEPSKPLDTPAQRIPPKIPGTPLISATENGRCSQSRPDSTTVSSHARVPEPKPPSSKQQMATDTIPLGWRVQGDSTTDPVTIALGSLSKHTVILAGAGSGKTVLVKRLVEEAALAGIPSIVIDCANDLAALDQRWPSPPEGWRPDDPDRANRYHQSTEVVLWTPGKESGNPVAFEPLPDLAAVADNPDELESAVAMAAAALEPIVCPGNTLKARNMRGILYHWLRNFAAQGGGRLEAFIALLQDLPIDGGLGLNREADLGIEMADALRVAIATNPLLRSQGTPLDPAVLFGDDHPSEKVRISVLNFIGLAHLDAQRHFLNQLAMTLFSWIKLNPNPGSRPLRGLLVLDEARDFVPSVKASSCKDSLIRLTAQARKYGLGLVFATQNPKDIDNKIIGNCSTHLYGKASSPTALDVIQEQISLRGGGGNDVAQLPKGRFYVHNADLGLKAPIKVAIPNCLSQHPRNPLDETQILSKASASRRILGR